MDISLGLGHTDLKLCMIIEDIVMEGTVSQIFHIRLHSFFIKCRENVLKNEQNASLFYIKWKLGPK